MRTAILLALIVPACAFAQTGTGAGSGPAVARSGVFSATIGPITRQNVIAGQPYSCDQVSEHTQTLADGTHISDRRTVVKMYRDSAGRTRTERPFFVPPAAVAVEAPTMIEIFDAVAGYRYVLDSTKKVAHRSPVSAMPAPPNAIAPGTARAIASQTAWANLPSPAAMIASASTGTISSTTQSGRPEISTESLGTKLIDGNLAEGRRTTMTYAIGSIGNDRPVVVTQEMWTSTELRLMLLSTNRDPRSGDNTIRIENLTRAEPDPSLFQVPPDYEVVDDTGPVTLQFSAPPAAK